jgi:hypothetical protein
VRKTHFMPMSHHRKAAVVGLFVLFTLLGWTSHSWSDELQFNRDIRSILAEHCFACHGPGEQEAGLRLDSFAAATAELPSGLAAIVSGDPAASELLVRIQTNDPDLMMPPPHANKPLTQDKRDRLRQWIHSGAAYEQHWAFTPIRRPQLPRKKGLAAENPIDQFVDAHLAEQGLKANQAADRPTLIRRLAFALTGLPPTVAEADVFLNDPSPTATAALINRLLTSPHYGEEMARHWLDVARYADTHGLHLDNERQMWAFRDWVVEAFNENLRFDEFAVWQLAGDLLPEASRDQKVATGFLRCNVTTSEGGSIGDELLFRYAVDRTATTLNAFMGLTGQCAVCHDHKFDPLSQREFYSLYAFFNSAADPGFDGNKILTPPILPLPTDEQQQQLEALKAVQPDLRRAVRQGLQRVTYSDPATLDPPPKPQQRQRIWLDDEFPPGAVLEGGPGTITWLTGGQADGVFVGQRSLERTAEAIGQDFYSRGAAPIEIRPQEEIFAHVWLDPDNPPASIMLQFNVGGWNHRAVWGDSERIPWGTPHTPSRHHVGELPAAGQWSRVSVSAAALGLTPGTKVNGFALTQHGGHVRWDCVGGVFVDDPAQNPAESFTAWWAENAGKKNLADIPKPLHKLLKAGPEKTTAPADIEKLQEYWLTDVWLGQPAALAEAVQHLKTNQQATTKLEESITKTFIFSDLPKMRNSFVMKRGNYDQPGQPVKRQTPAFLPPLRATNGKPPNRLDLARWLVSSEHPLTARVAANRLWQQFFGTGLVKTSEDFGLQGVPPSHPELLDWLAAEYQACGWDTRHMVRLMVSSRAFQRDSRITPEQQTADPANRFLARGPRFRLDAEQIRDNALAVSGLLIRTRGGKGDKPYQPPNIWEPVGFGNSNTRYYKQDTGDSLYRRSIYTFLKRTAPPPFMVNFDAPNREQFCARRERSNTPLQALQLMNDTQHIEAARALATRVLLPEPSNDAHDGTDRQQVDRLFRLLLTRRPTSEEQAVTQAFLQTARNRYQTDSTAAGELIAHGETSAPADLDAAELAAWTLVANMLFNLDETLCRN